jgi:hypothetical protein
MSSSSCIYRQIRGRSPNFPLIPEVGRRKVVLQGQKPKFHRSLSDLSSLSSSPLPYIFKMSSTSSGIGSSGYGGGTSSSSSSQHSVSTSIKSIYSHVVPIQSTTNLAKVIKKYGLFQFEEDDTTTLWHFYSPLNLACATNPFPNFKEQLPKFSGNDTISTEEHLISFFECLS